MILNLKSFNQMLTTDPLEIVIIFLSLHEKLRYVYLFSMNLSVRDINKYIRQFTDQPLDTLYQPQSLHRIFLPDNIIFFQGRNHIYMRKENMIYQWTDTQDIIKPYLPVPSRHFVTLAVSSHASEEIKFLTLDEKRRLAETITIWDNDCCYTISQQGITTTCQDKHVEYSLQLRSRPTSACVRGRILYILTTCNEHESYIYTFKVYKWHIKSKLRNPKRQTLKQLLRVNNTFYAVKKEGYQRYLTYITG